VLTILGAPTFSELAPLQTGRLTVGDVGCDLIRHDIGGDSGVELFVPADRAQDVWRSLVALDDVTPVGFDALNTRRIECGIPWPLSEITNEVLPAETSQFDRAVNIHKGCYLGQEVVERMRSRGSLARKLVLIRLDGDHVPERGQDVMHDDKPVGRLTSTCYSSTHGRFLALAYVRAPHAVLDTRLVVGHSGNLVAGVVVAPESAR